jgi:thymidine kinase
MSCITDLELHEDDCDLNDVDNERLELIMGPMSSGKSTMLGQRMEVYGEYRTTATVNTKKDTRYGNDGVVTHSGKVIPAIRVECLWDLQKDPVYRKARVVGIDEGNHFPEIKDFVIDQLAKTNKSFVVVALDGDKDKRPFGSVHLLIPEAEKKTFLHAVCKRCADGTRASFTFCHRKFEGQVYIAGKDAYEAVCRKHYNHLTLMSQVDEIRRSTPELKISK